VVRGSGEVMSSAGGKVLAPSLKGIAKARAQSCAWTCATGFEKQSRPTGRRGPQTAVLTPAQMPPAPLYSSTVSLMPSILFPLY
jgi:hypothetical protein